MSTSSTVQKFTNTTNAPENFLADPPKVERSNYYDIGISRQITEAVDDRHRRVLQAGATIWSISANSARRSSRRRSITQTGKVYGAEWSSTYKQGGFSAFGNAAWVETRAHDIDSQQFQIDNDELAYIQTHDIKLDHEAEFAGSAGACISVEE